jgi:hypothetical protein
MTRRIPPDCGVSVDIGCVVVAVAEVITGSGVVAVAGIEVEVGVT